ncbi:MAG: glycine zipper domain-containing protein [Enterobacter hormaechei]
MKKRVLLLPALVSGALAVSGCTTNPYTGEREAGKSGIGAGIGSLVGAGVGALSSSTKDRGKGALIGAAAGAALGGGVGYYMDVQEAKLRDKMKGTGVSVTRSGDNIILNMPNNVTFDSSSATLKPGREHPDRRGRGAERVQQNCRERDWLHRQYRSQI